MCNRMLLSFGKMPQWNCHANGTIFERGLRLPVVKLPCKRNSFSKRFDISNGFEFFSGLNLLLIVSQIKSRRYVCGAGYDFFFLLIIWGKVLGEQKELVAKIYCPPPLIHSKFASQNIPWRLACNDAEQAITS